MDSSCPEDSSGKELTPIPNNSCYSQRCTPDTTKKSAGYAQYKSYPYPSGGKNIKRGKDELVQRNKFHKFVAKCPFIFDAFTVSFTIGVAIMGLIIFYKFLDEKMISSGYWGMREASHYNFEEFSVASTSEHCDEIARQWMIESHNTHEIALMMKTCLQYFDPQVSATFGESLFVFTSIDGKERNTRCWQSTGFRGPQVNLKTFIDIVKLSPSSAFLGPLSMVVPGDIRSTMSLIFDMGNNGLEKAEKVYQKFEHQVNGLLIPASERLVRAMNHRSLELQITTRRGLDSLNKYVKRPGDTFSNIWSSMELKNIRRLKLALNGTLFRTTTTNAMQKELAEKFTELTRGEAKKMVDVWMDHALMGNISFKLNIKPFEVASQKSRYSICAPMHYDMDTLESLPSLTVTALTKLLQMNKNVPLMTPFHQDENHYVRVAQAMEDMYGRTARFGRKKMVKRTAEVRELYKQLAKLDRTRSMPTDGIAFVLVNHRTSEAVAYSGSIGTSFGSLIQMNGIEFMNNLMSLVGQDYKQLGDMHHYMEPIIVTKRTGKENKVEIELAYVDLNDMDYPATNMARKMSSIFLRLFYGQPLKDVLRWALYYIDIRGQNSRSRHLPLHRLESIMRKNKQIGNQTKKLEEGDLVMAVDRKASIKFSNTEIEKKTWRCPLGL